MLGLNWKYLVRFSVQGAFRRAGTYVTPEDNGSDNCQVEDESGSIVGLPGILFRLCHNQGCIKNGFQIKNRFFGNLKRFFQ